MKEMGGGEAYNYKSPISGIMAFLKIAFGGNSSIKYFIGYLKKISYLISTTT